VFAGIVEALGTVARIEIREPGGLLEVSGGIDPAALRTGESVCTSGVCLTVRTVTDGGFIADLSDETVARTSLGDLREGDRLNLERSLQVGDRISGHFVFGHVDGVGEIAALDPAGEGWTLRVRAPGGLAPYLVDKGSIAVDGISLTMCGCTEDSFAVAVIPHTYAVTNLAHRRVGDRVNLEADMLARYARRALEALRRERAEGSTDGGKVTPARGSGRRR
jgi:riboflavin synthase